MGRKDLNFKELKRTTVYQDGYTRDSISVTHFWRVIEEHFEAEHKRKFLRFLTGSEMSPVKGLGAIRMKISRAGPDSERLPSAHTCYNHLLLPDYQNYEKMRTKLLKAIENFQGFGLL